MNAFAVKVVKGEGNAWLRRGAVAPFLLLNLLLVFSAEAADRPHPKIVAEVNQAHITTIALRAEVRSYLRKIGHQELSPFRMAAVQRGMLKKLIEEELLYQEGLKLQQEETPESEFSVTEAELEAGILKVRNRFPSDKAFEASLEKEGLSKAEIRKGIGRSLLIQKTWEALSSMGSEKRIKRLKEMTESAAIQIHSHPVEINGESLAINAPR